jgi:membrane protein
MERPTKKKLINSAFRFANGLTYKDLAAYASSTAFFFFIAIIPLMIILSKLLPYTGITDDQLKMIITKFTPDFADMIVILVIDQAFTSTTGIISISAAVLLYATARGMLALLRGLNRIYLTDGKSNGFILQVRAIFYTLLMVVDLVLLLVIIVFGKTIMDFLVGHIKVLDKAPLVYSFRYLLLFALGVLICMVTYTFLPAVRQPFRKQFIGAVFSALAWMVFSFFFSLFISSSIYSTYYGSLAAIAIFMMWLYGCFYILLIGANLNHSLYGVRLPHPFSGKVPSS